MAPALGLLLAAALGGCVSHDIATPKPLVKTIIKPVVREQLRLDDHLIGVATLSDRDALLAEAALTKNGIPYGTFVDISSTGIVVKSDHADRARRIIREDSWDHGYKLLERITPTPETDRVTVRHPAPTLPSTITKAPPITAPTKATFSKPVSPKLVTVVSIATKDAKLAIDCLNANGIKAPGTWETDGVSGIVVPAVDAKNALSLIQADAKLRHYTLLSTTRKAETTTISDEPASAENLKSEGSLVVSVRERDASKVAEYLESHNISSFQSCDFGSCGVYVSKYDADQAMALLRQEMHSVKR